MNTEHYCKSCKSEKDLHKASSYVSKSGVLRTYYMCNSCSAERRRKWYYSGGREKAVVANKKYRAKVRARKLLGIES